MRFIFRQVDFRDFQTFIHDGRIVSKNYQPQQTCHQTSYSEIINRRNTSIYELPHGGVVNDYVPFYFSPLTSFTYAISKGKVNVIDPSGNNLGISNENDRIFFVGDPITISNYNLKYCFSDIALNSLSPPPTLSDDINHLEDLVNWKVFDEHPISASIEQIGYKGVCQYFHNCSNPEWKMNRSMYRMAEFLIQNEVPLNLLKCIVVKTEEMQTQLQNIMNLYDLDYHLPIYVVQGCYWK